MRQNRETNEGKEGTRLIWRRRMGRQKVNTLEWEFRMKTLQREEENTFSGDMESLETFNVK